MQLVITETSPNGEQKTRIHKGADLAHFCDVQSRDEIMMLGIGWTSESLFRGEDAFGRLLGDPHFGDYSYSTE